MTRPVSVTGEVRFGSAENAALVRQGLEEAQTRVTGIVGGEKRMDVVEVAKAGPGDALAAKIECRLTLRELHLLRYALDQAIEDV